MRLITLAICLICCTRVLGQYERAYKLKSAIERRLMADTNPWKNMFASYDYSFSGYYRETLSFGDSTIGHIRKIPRLETPDAAYLAGFKPASARNYILHRAVAERILNINEAHHQPLHRTFVTSLLKDLCKQGYRYLGIETLGRKDTLLHQRKYPVKETGFYSFEPQFGNMIREALETGFTLFPYETENTAHDGKEREIDQAKNIVAFMQQHTKGKYLIYCGYAHVLEGPYQSWEKTMAGRLKEYTGINPFTIDQERLTGHSSPLYEKPDYTAIHAAFPAVLINQHKVVYNGLARDTSVDLLVYHPRTIYINGRPNWLLLNQQRKPWFVPGDKIKIRYPILAFAYVNREDPAIAIPYDVVELSHPREKKALILQKGKYTLVLKNEKEEQVFKIEVK